MPRPMLHMLRRVARRTSLHMPATGGKPPCRFFHAYRWDTTEIPQTDDLYQPTGAIAQAEALMANRAGAAATLLLSGGSTAGVHAMLLYAAKRGQEVILPRNVHVSALSLCATAGLVPVFAEPSFTPEGRLFTTAAAYAAALDAHPGAACAFALYVDYYGLLSDLPAIASVVHARGKLLLCDEAHGAYFNWRGDIPNALACGAEMAVQSAHKTLPALTAGAWLHAAPGVDAGRLRAMLRMVQTSSPSFLTMLSLDEARVWMDRRGQAALDGLARRLVRLRRKAAQLGYTDGQASPPDGMRYDALRMVLCAPEGGAQLAETLAKRRVDVEMADAAHIVCIVPLQRTARVLRRFWRALRYAARCRDASRPKGTFHALAPVAPDRPALWPQRRMPLHEAAFAPCEPVRPALAAGRISAATVGLYPPGVAWMTAGDEVTPEIAMLMDKIPPERFFGLDRDGMLPCVRQENA
ncbi:MAG: DegT/DnrJ/EryC1/StrS family aminotransferase [Candidatus Limiplasma sp.]|nr:DegT/DnrJ/EryC1/StrS family aminotransferase [Candidatus Limiplasma sp.]